MKLQRYITEFAQLARRKAIQAIEDGRVYVDGKKETKPFVIINSEHTQIKLDGEIIKPRKSNDIMLLINKPEGVLTSDYDEEGRPLVKTLFNKKIKQRLFPVGRLDFNSQGLIIYTNNGSLAEKLSHPRFKVPRVYRVKVHGILDKKVLLKLEKGLYIPDLGYFPGCSAHIDRVTGKNCWINITVHQGRNREIRKLFQHLAFPVIKLVRISYGPFSLTGIPRGSYRLVTGPELKQLDLYLEQNEKKVGRKKVTKKGRS